MNKNSQLVIDALNKVSVDRPALLKLFSRSTEVAVNSCDISIRHYKPHSPNDIYRNETIILTVNGDSISFDGVTRDDRTPLVDVDYKNNPLEVEAIINSIERDYFLSVLSLFTSVSRQRYSFDTMCRLADAGWNLSITQELFNPTDKIVDRNSIVTFAFHNTINQRYFKLQRRYGLDEHGNFYPDFIIKDNGQRIVITDEVGGEFGVKLFKKVILTLYEMEGDIANESNPQ